MKVVVCINMAYDKVYCYINVSIAKNRYRRIKTVAIHYSYLMRV